MNVVLALLPLFKVATDITLMAMKNTADPRSKDVRYAKKVARAKKRYVIAYQQVQKSRKLAGKVRRRRRRRAQAEWVYWRSVLEELNEPLPTLGAP